MFQSNTRMKNLMFWNNSTWHEYDFSWIFIIRSNIRTIFSVLGNVIIKVLANETRDLFLYKSSTRQVILLWLKGKEHLWQHFDCLNQCYDSNGPIIIYLLFEISVLCLKNAFLILAVISTYYTTLIWNLKFLDRKKYTWQNSYISIPQHNK